MLPENLGTAIDVLIADEVLIAALGEHVVTHFVEAKRIEWNMYRTQVSEWEREQYFATY